MIANYLFLATNVAVAFVFPPLTTLSLSVDFGAGVTLDTTGTPSMSALAGQNSTTLNSTQATKTKQPSIAAAQLNGKQGGTFGSGSTRVLVSDPFLNTTFNTSFSSVTVNRCSGNTGYIVTNTAFKPDASLSFYMAKALADDQLYFDTMGQVVDAGGSGVFNMLGKAGSSIDFFNYDGVTATLGMGYLRWNTRRTGNMNVSGAVFTGARETNQYVFAGDMYRHIVGKSMSRAEQLALVEKLNADNGIYDASHQAYKNVNFIFQGNSICYGVNSQTRSYPAVVGQLLKSGNCHNFGDSGKTTPQLNTLATGNVDIVFDPTATKNILILNEGINDLKAGVNELTAYNNIKTYCQNRKIANPSLIIVVVGLTNRTDVGNPAQYEIDRVAVNNRIAAARSAGETWVDVFSRVDLNSSLNPVNTTFYGADGVHPNNAGAIIWANTVFASLLTILHT